MPCIFSNLLNTATSLSLSLIGRVYLSMLDKKLLRQLALGIASFIITSTFSAVV